LPIAAEYTSASQTVGDTLVNEVNRAGSFAVAGSVALGAAELGGTEGVTGSADATPVPATTAAQTLDSSTARERKLRTFNPLRPIINFSHILAGCDRCPKPIRADAERHWPAHFHDDNPQCEVSFHSLGL